LTSHGATLPGLVVVGVVLDWVHVLAAAAWVGGLAGLFVLSPLLLKEESAGSGLLRSVVRRFTRLAIVAVVALALSGTAQAAVETGSLEALLQTPYGQAVLVKVLLLLCMLAVAAVNQRRATSSESDGQTRRFLGSLRFEFALGIAALVAAAVVTGTPPARQTVPGQGTVAQVSQAQP
jgi:putative copper export protein